MSGLPAPTRCSLPGWPKLPWSGSAGMSRSELNSIMKRVRATTCRMNCWNGEAGRGNKNRERVKKKASDERVTPLNKQPSQVSDQGGSSVKGVPVYHSDFFLYPLTVLFAAHFCIHSTNHC